MAGRPSKYKEEYQDQAKKLCKLGFTDKELSVFFEVDEATINRWKDKYPDFCKSLKEGKDIADAEVVEKLYQRACGYEHKAVKILTNKVTHYNDDGKPISANTEPLIVPYIEHYPPDPTSMIYWLKNRQSEKWIDKPMYDGGDDSDKIAEAIRSLKE